MKLYLHRWTNVGANDHRDMISGSSESCGLAGYAAVEEIDVDAPEQLTTQDGKLYWRGFECVGAIGNGQIHLWDNYPKDTQHLGNLLIKSRRSI